jgi:NAD+ diphosphatase
LLPLPGTGLLPEPFFSGPGIDRADLLRSDPGEIERLATSDTARELVWRDGFPAVDAEGCLEWQPVSNPDLFLGLSGGEPRFSAALQPVGDTRAGFPVIATLRPQNAPLFAAALSLAGWHARHGFCASCGAASDLVRGGWSRRCPLCSTEHFPRVDPVVIMLAEHDGRVLLGRQPHYPPGRYSALAGFVEVGESIEAAVARELQEEAGIRAGEVAYVASQPWPFPSSLMIGCHALAIEDALTIDTTEIEDARWFSRSEIRAAIDGDPGAPFLPPPRAAIARTLLEHWLECLK